MCKHTWTGGIWVQSGTALGWWLANAQMVTQTIPDYITLQSDYFIQTFICVFLWFGTRLGDGSFVVAGPQVWNVLLDPLCLVDNICILASAKSSFVWLRLRHLLTFCFLTPCINFLTYLLTYLLIDGLVQTFTKPVVLQSVIVWFRWLWLHRFN